MKKVKNLIDIRYSLFTHIFPKIKKTYFKFVKIYPASSITHFYSILVISLPLHF